MRISILRKIMTLTAVAVLGGVNTSGFYGRLAEGPVYSVAETRCGWFVNPTPANAWLIDAGGEWIIGTQGGEQAEGDWPEFKGSQWVKTNINYGYGCACMKVETNKAEERITRIISGNAKALSACRKDKALTGKEPGR